MSNINLALLQTPASFKNKLEIFERVENIINEESQQVDLICLPELFSSNINLINLDEIAEAIDGETFDFLSNIAKKKKSYIVAGILEKADDNYYNTAIFIDKNGDLIGKHRKVVLNEFEHNFLEHGDCVNIFNTELGKVGIVIGNDLNSLEISNELAIQDVDIIVYITQVPYDYSCIVECAAISRVMDIPTYLLISSNCGTSNISRLEFKGLTSVLYNRIMDNEMFELKVEDFILNKIKVEEFGVLYSTINIDKLKEFKECETNIIKHKEIVEILQKV